MIEEVKPKKSDEKKPKEKKTSSSSGARTRYHGNQPGIHKKVRKIVHSNGVDAAKKFIAANTSVVGLNRDLDQATAKRNKRLERKANRKKNPSLQANLVAKKIVRINARIVQAGKDINERTLMEENYKHIVINPSDTPEEQRNCEQMKKDLEQYLECGPDLPELHSIRTKLNERKAKLEGKLGYYRSLISS